MNNYSQKTSWGKSSTVPGKASAAGKKYHAYRPAKNTLIRLSLLFVTLFCLVMPPCAAALEIPALTARINDRAEVLTPATKGELEAKLAALEKEDSTQIALLTVPTLAGENLEHYALRVFNAWGLGQKNKDNGVLLLIALQERKLRIEVGYGLEDKLTDELCARIIRNDIMPAFRNGDFNLGVSRGVAALIQAVKGAYQPASLSDFDMAGFGIMAFFLFIIASNVGKACKRHIGLALGAGGLSGLCLGLLLPLSMTAAVVVAFLGAALAAVWAAPSTESGAYDEDSHNHHRPAHRNHHSDHSSGGFSGGGGSSGGGGASGSW